MMLWYFKISSITRNGVTTVSDTNIKGFEIPLIFSFSEILVSEQKSDRVRKLQFSALRTLAGHLRYYKSLGYMDSLLYAIDELYDDEQLIGDADIIIRDQNSTFDFEEERLAKAFYQLPLMKRKILEMLFVENIKPDEIAKRLNCSPQYVYNQRLRAIKKLREELAKGGDIYDE